MAVKNSDVLNDSFLRRGTGYSAPCELQGKVNVPRLKVAVSEACYSSLGCQPKKERNEVLHLLER